jgi:hypothetical protein
MQKGLFISTYLARIFANASAIVAGFSVVDVAKNDDIADCSVDPKFSFADRVVRFDNVPPDTVVLEGPIGIVVSDGDMGNVVLDGALVVSCDTLVELPPSSFDPWNDIIGVVRLSESSSSSSRAAMATVVSTANVLTAKRLCVAAKETFCIAWMDGVEMPSSRALSGNVVNEGALVGTSVFDGALVVFDVTGSVVFEGTPMVFDGTSVVFDGARVISWKSLWLAWKSSLVVGRFEVISTISSNRFRSMNLSRGFDSLDAALMKNMGRPGAAVLLFGAGAGVVVLRRIAS